jgi:PIN domain nuclease of toxin-antitoxin system
MNVLLDTHVLLWILADSGRLSPSAVRVYQNPDNALYVSIASFWEIGIKISLGKLSLHTTDWAGEISKELELNGIRQLPIAPAHCAMVATLPFRHRDPFDRLLVAQALCEGMALMTADAALTAYEIKIVW